jgi:hypothetical protein
MFLWLGLVLALWINYETWQRDYALPPPPPVVTNPERPAIDGGGLAGSAGDEPR